MSVGRVRDVDLPHVRFLSIMIGEVDLLFLYAPLGGSLYHPCRHVITTLKVDITDGVRPTEEFSVV